MPGRHGRSGGGKRKRGAGGRSGSRPVKRRRKKTREEKAARDQALAQRILAKRARQEAAALSSSSDEGEQAPKPLEGYAALLKSMGVERQEEDDFDEGEPEEAEEVEEEMDPEEIEAKLAALEAEVGHLEEMEEDEEMEEGEEEAGAEGVKRPDARGYRVQVVDAGEEADDESADAPAAVLPPGAATDWWRRHFHRAKAPKPVQRPLAVEGNTCSLAPIVQSNVDWSAFGAGKKGLRRKKAAKPAASGSLQTAIQSYFPGDGGPAGWPPHLWERLCASVDDTALLKPLLTALGTYADLLYPLRTWDNGGAVMSASLAHALAHVWRSKELVHANNRARKEAEAKGEDVDAGDADDTRWRDQGYQKQRVVFILPMRNLCRDYVLRMIDLWGAKEVLNKDQFLSNFEELDVDKDPKFKKRTLDYRNQFSGNVDDRFCFGVSLTAKRVRLMCGFPSADIMFASPLGIAFTMKKNAKQGADFLSSAEVVIADQADCLLMQNFQWTRDAFSNLNSQPRSVTDSADINRIHRWLLDGDGRRMRQVAVFSRVTDAELNSLFRTEAQSTAGQIRCSRNFAGEITRVVNSARHLFHRVDVTSPAAASEERFAFFKEKVFPRLRGGIYSGIGSMSALLVVPSYFDYVKLRGFLDDVDRDSFAELCEYTHPKDMFQSIKDFNARLRSFLLMTERFYFFRRYVLRGVKTIIFYQLPICTWFYSELVNQLQTDGQAPTVLTLYSKYDSYSLQRVLGTDRARKVVAAEGGAHMFC
eukprot:TRINITY_DN35926_c0_g1_i1.p1 TRINITY_DN35926_c0_g1~~TRINITY_DN35926_c0_g1_i1.p1  ORF type:complete len:760 (+),score=246.67 TRINITY_DN35926_c0_g1_i1:68-2347(+)